MLASLPSGPPAVSLVLGDAYRPAPGMVAIVTAATCVMAGALLKAAALVALERQAARYLLGAAIAAAGAHAELSGD